MCILRQQTERVKRPIIRIRVGENFYLSVTILSNFNLGNKIIFFYRADLFLTLGTCRSVIATPSDWPADRRDFCERPEKTGKDTDP